MTTEIRQDTGYGLIPKRIMRDKNLTIQAKAIYSYLASFAGNTGRAFPSVSLMLGELGISRDTFYRYRNELEEAGAIEVVKERTEGQFARNIYFLHNAINPPCPKSSYTVNSTTVKPDTVSSYTVNQDTISNNLKSNNSISNNNNSNSPGGGGSRLTKEMITEIVDQWNKLGLQNLRSINSNTNRHTSLKARIEEYSYEEVLDAIERINSSSFLKGQNDRGWTITFDWLVRPNNFIKVIEGNYDDKGGGPGGEVKSNRGSGENQGYGIVSPAELSDSPYDI